MNRNTEKDKARFLEKLKEAMGIIKAACDATGISRQCYYNWYDGDEEFRKRAEEIMEERIDVVEASLISQIKKGNAIATIFFLKTKARHRGYIEPSPFNQGMLPTPGGMSLEVVKEEMPYASLLQIANTITSGKAKKFAGPIEDAVIVNEKVRPKANGRKRKSG